MTTGELLRSAWQPAPIAGTTSVVTLAFYGWRWRAQLSMRGICFVAAAVLFWLALASPVAVLAHGYLFSAHMLQHLVLLLAVPTLALIGLPREVTGGDARDRRPKRRSWHGSRPRSWRSSPVLPWLAGVGAMWVWHERSLCDAAALRPGIQALQTGSLVTAGLFFWWPILRPRPQERLPPFPAVLYLFSACAACSVLGILVTFSPIEVCSVYAHPVDRLGVLPLLRQGWGLSPSADQQLGGLMMWIPACLVYAAAILAVLARHYREEESTDRSTASPGALPQIPMTGLK